MKGIYKSISVLAVCSLFFLNTVLAEEFEAKSQPIQKSHNPSDVFDSRFDELTILLNWAAYLSGYKTNGVNPRLQFKPHQFFVDNACYGNTKCRVVGWYNDQGIVYIDNKLDALNSRFERSLIVHEFVHYLQHISGEFTTGSCEEFVQREREAYSTQRDFIMAYGSMPSMSFLQHSCIANTTKKNEIANN